MYRVCHEKVAVFRFALVLVIFSLALVCILRRVFEQLVNSRAVTVFILLTTTTTTTGRPRSHVVGLDSSVYATDPG